MSDSHIWDASTVATFDAIETEYRAKGQERGNRGLNPERLECLAGHLCGGR